MKECLKRELECTKYMNKYSKKTPEDNKRRFERLLKVFGQAYEEVTIDTLPRPNYWEWRIIFTVDNGRRGKSFIVHYDKMDDVAFHARFIFNEAIDVLKLEEKEMEQKRCSNCKHYHSSLCNYPCRDCDIARNTLWEPKEPFHPYIIDTDMPIMYPTFTVTYDVNKFDSLIPGIRDVIFNDPATIVFWADGTKTVVRCQDGEAYDPEKGLAMAISKKALGNTREYYHTFLHELKKVKK